MSLWQFQAAVNGYNEAHSTGSQTPPSDEEFEELQRRQWIDEKKSSKPKRQLTFTELKGLLNG